MLSLWIHTVLIVAVLGGIAWRRRWRATLAFPLHLGISLAYKLRYGFGLSDSADWLTWLLADLSQNILALCVAVEIGARIFPRELVGGRTHTGRVLVAVLALGLVATLLWGRALLGSVSDRDLYFALVEGSRRVALTTTAAFTLLGFMVVSFLDWPLDSYHRDVGLGFLLYQWVFVLLMPWPDATPILPEVWPVWLYTGVLLLWARAAWRAVDDLGLQPSERALAFPWQRVSDGH